VYTLTELAERLEHVKNSPRSVSQINQYRRCPYSYYLQRIAGAWQRPAAWLPMGTAVHAAAEAYERSGRSMSLEATQDVFREHYAADTNAMCEETPRFDWWFASGPYGGEADVERRYGLGLEQVARYLAYYEGKGSDDVVWITPDGTPAIELEFEIEIGGVPVRGYIDVVMTTPKGIIVRDNKTGRSPGDELQLAVYAEAIRQDYGQSINHGDYWMGRSGKPTVLYDLFEWGPADLAEQFQEMDAAVKAEKFEPKPDPDKCRFCSVSSACSFSLA
jgi:putative RecB family exonuclease